MVLLGPGDASLTPLKCRGAAAVRGLPLFALQGSACFGGSNLTMLGATSEGRVADGHCATPCPGDAATPCGSAKGGQGQQLLLSVYRVMP